MKRVFLHSMKVMGKHWFWILVGSAISWPIGIGVFLLFLIFSLIFSEDPVSISEIKKAFTKRELAIVSAKTVNENVTDEEYLTLLARYQTFLCPRKVDSITTWVGSEVTDGYYIMNYELKKSADGIDLDVLKRNILNDINPKCVQSIRLIRSNKDMVFKYTCPNTGDTFSIVVTSNELKAL